MAAKERVMVDLGRIAGPPETGLHRLRLTQMESRDGQSGFPYLACTYAIEEASVDNGKTIWDNVSLSPKARFRVEPWLDALDAPEEGRVDPMSFVGKVVWAILDHDEYNGNLKAVVAEYLTAEQAESHGEYGDRFSELNGEMGGQPDFYDPDEEDEEDRTEDLEEFDEDEFEVPV